MVGARVWTAAVIALVGVSGCSGGPDEAPAPGPSAESAASACPAGGEGPPSVEEATRLVGEYTLILESEDGSKAEAGLTLETLPEEDSAAPTLPGADDPQPGRALLRGWTDLDASLVSAFAPGALDSRDPARPGVLLLASPGSGGGPSLMLRLGAQVNDRQRTDFDGGHFALTIQWTGADASFGGSWTSRGGGRRASGSFCALPASP